MLEHGSLKYNVNVLFWKRVLLSWYRGVKAESFWVEVDENVVIAIRPPFVIAVHPQILKTRLGVFVPSYLRVRSRAGATTSCLDAVKIIQ